MEISADRDGNTFYLNMGPQHPSTHGVLRVILKMNGEYIQEAECVLGYIHRMHEKIGESMFFSQFYAYMSRMDYLSAMAYNHGYTGLIEKMAGIEPPLRAEYIRVITVELNRISSHLVWLGAYLLDLGAFTPIMYAFDDREMILDLLESITGSRLTYSYFRFGGVCKDIDEDFIRGTRAFIKKMRSRLKMYDTLVTKNVIFIGRVKDIGIISQDMARRYGATGPVLRGSGIEYDIRKNEPYSVYPEFDFDIPTGSTGDARDRYLVRVAEIEQSLRIIEQALDRLPDGPYRTEIPPFIELEPGDCYFPVESARGEFGIYLVSNGKKRPYRMKLRTPSFSNLSLFNELTKGYMIADAVSILGSLDLVIPEIDR